MRDTLGIKSHPNLALSLTTHMSTCKKYPIGSNALWEGHGIFSSESLQYYSPLCYSMGYQPSWIVAYGAPNSVPMLYSYFTQYTCCLPLKLIIFFDHDHTYDLALQATYH